MVHLLRTLPEDEAKPLVIKLVEEGDRYSKQLDELCASVKAQKGFDFMYVNPHYPSAYNPQNW